LADHTTVKDTMKAAMLSPSLRDQFGANGREYVERVHDARNIR
jgi:hypothetical protein